MIADWDRCQCSKCIYLILFLVKLSLFRYYLLEIHINYCFEYFSSVKVVV